MPDFFLLKKQMTGVFSDGGSIVLPVPVSAVMKDVSRGVARGGSRTTFVALQSSGCDIGTS